jgi:hypothetical protein
MKDAKECLAAAFTLLVMKNVVTVEEVQAASKKGTYDDIFDLLNRKYKELKLEGE